MTRLAASAGARRGADMAKISALPIVQAPSGDEEAVVLKNGATHRVPMRDLVAGAIDAAYPVELSYPLDAGIPNGSAGNGASLRRRGSLIYGITVPAGSTGNDSFVLQPIDVRSLGIAGGRVKVSMTARTSPDLVLSAVLYVRADTASAGLQILGATLGSQEGDTRLWTAEYDVPVGTLTLSIFPYVTNNAPIAAERWIEPTEIRLRVAASGARPLVNPSAETMAASERRLAARVRSDDRFYAPPVLVTAPGEGGDFTSLGAALTSIHDASPANRGLILVAPRPQGAPYVERDLFGSDYIDVRTIGDQIVEIRGELPDDASPSDIIQSSTVNLHHDMLWRGFRFTARNMRYACHADDPSSSGKLLRTEFCQFEHYGNEGARQHQIALGYDPDGYGGTHWIWASLCAWGSGLWSGSRVEHLKTSFVSPVDAYLAHDPASSPAPQVGSTILAEYCNFSSNNGAAATAIKLQSYGGGKPMLFTAIGCDIRGRIECERINSDRQWWVADGYGNTGGAFVENGQYVSRMI